MGSRPKRLHALVGLIFHHGGALEADLQRFYRVDLRDLFRGGLTFRRLEVLIAHLPADAATVAILAPHVDTSVEPEHERLWTTTQHLLATVVDQLSWLGWMQAAANSKQAPPKPEPMKRPGAKKAPKRLTAEQRARIDAINLGGGRHD